MPTRAALTDAGGRVRALATAEQLDRERADSEQAARRGPVALHGTHRSELLVESLDIAWD